MSKWRPEGWSDKRDQTQETLRSSSFGLKTKYKDWDWGYEAGADAMLEVLRKEGRDNPGPIVDRSGVMVFIPDDKE